MAEWKISFHNRKVRKWDYGLRKTVQFSVPTVECRKKLGTADALISVRGEEVLLSLNGPATITSKELQMMESIIFMAKAEWRVRIS